jgi:hypothetical protein
MRRQLEGDPVARIRKFNGFTGWSKQDEIIRELYGHRRVAVQSSHGAGKTAVAAAIVEDFMRLGPCRVVTTAPTWFQVETLLWAEIHRRVREARVPWQTRPNKTTWKIRDNWAAYGLSPKEPERFQGHHGRRVLLVVDEASGVEEEIFEAGQGFLTGHDSYVLYISNPTKMSGAFYRACQPDSGFHHVKISTFDTPYFTGEEVAEDTLRSLPSQGWVNGRVDEWGEDDPRYRVRVLGEFAHLTGRAYFNIKQIDSIEVTEPKFRGFLTGDAVRGGRVVFNDDSGGELRIWKAPEGNRRYMIFGDVAGQVREEEWEAREDREKGSGDDWCAAQVLDMETGEQVAELQAQMDPDVYGRALARLGYVYHGSDRAAWLGVEANNMGQATLTELKHLRYPKLWRRQKYELVRGSRAAALGLVTTRDARERMLAFLRATLRQAPGRLHSAWLVAELRSFVFHESGYGSAASGTHDDLVIGIAGALEMRDQIVHKAGSDEAAAA